jgi:hypothetical protein
LASKFEKKTNTTLKIFFLQQIKKVSKNAEFHTDLESVEKVDKNAHKKNYKPNKFDEHE